MVIGLALRLAAMSLNFFQLMSYFNSPSVFEPKAAGKLDTSWLNAAATSV